MQSQRLTGPGAGAEKYDLLTALAVNGLAEGGARQASMMRLIALVTARYNWTSDEVVIGQREMAALWSVDERTAKRETRRLIDAGFLEIKRPGVRGRVAAYRLQRAEIYRLTRPGWSSVGPDYDARMAAREKPAAVAESPRVVKVDFTPRPAATPAACAEWQRVLDRLEADQPGAFAAWFRQLNAGQPQPDGVLVITAPSRFVAGYVTSHLLVSLERAVMLAYGRSLRCLLSVAAEPRQGGLGSDARPGASEGGQ